MYNTGIDDYPVNSMKIKIRSAGVMVVRRKAGQWCYLILRAFSNWDFPKGIIEPGEEAIDAAIREVEEETSINDLIFPWGHDFRETAPYGPGKVARYYLGVTQKEKLILPVNPELGHPEHEEYRWVSYDTAHKMLSPRLTPILEWAQQTIEPLT
jgi:8-oxo-dGTP pyrophosphatase MutT (NUDIX family)